MSNDQDAHSLPTALITGIAGQDGRYLAELLLAQGYIVHGVIRPQSGLDSATHLWRLTDILDQLTLHETALDDADGMRALLTKTAPGEIYHFAAQSSVSASFRDPATTLHSNIVGTENLFAAIRDVVPGARTYFAASCEMFGIVEHNPANESTPFNPVSPYGLSKLSGFHSARHFRDVHGLAITCGIAFNHDSPLRGREFVTSKIARGAARIAAGIDQELRVGNLDVRRDFGYAPDYVRAMWLLMTQHAADDFILATGRSTSLGDLLNAAFSEVGLEAEGYAKYDPALMRPADIRELWGDPAKIRAAVGWSATLTGEAVIRLMVQHELQQLERATSR